MPKKIYKDNAEKQRAYRQRKALERLKLRNQQKELDRQLETQDYSLSSQDTTTVPDLIEKGNYLCEENKNCLKAGYECKLGDKLYTCLYYLKLHPKPITVNGYSPSVFKDAGPQERRFYDKLRNEKERHRFGMQ